VCLHIPASSLLFSITILFSLLVEPRSSFCRFVCLPSREDWCQWSTAHCNSPGIIRLSAFSPFLALDRSRSSSRFDYSAGVAHVRELCALHYLSWVIHKNLASRLNDRFSCPSTATSLFARACSEGITVCKTWFPRMNFLPWSGSDPIPQLPCVPRSLVSATQSIAQ
jgi:hypothetical protein